MKNNHTPAQNKTVILNILNDAIIFNKVSSGFVSALAAFNPNEMETLEIEMRYTGYINAMYLLGVKDDDYQMIDALTQAFVFKSEVRKDAVTLAQEIYQDWNKLISLRSSEVNKVLIS